MSTDLDGSGSLEYNTTMQYLAILGRQPEFGLAELEATLGSDAVQPFGNQAAILTQQPNLAYLGGSLKTGEIIYQGPVADLETIELDLSKLPQSEGKTPFALSYYGIQATERFVLASGLNFKKRLKAAGFSSLRVISPGTGSAVTAAGLHHNRVLETGFELLIVVSQQTMIVARTLAVQDIDWYSQRDYERPARDAKVGMLPPKLAQILVNLSGGKTIYDPFCGTGVVLQEALLMGKPAQGSDIAPALVEASEVNLEWLATVAPSPLPAWSVTEADAQTVVLPPGVAIASEGYLGPNLTELPDDATLASIQAELETLYRNSLLNFVAQFEPGQQLAICVPAWKLKKGFSSLKVIDQISDLGYTKVQFVTVGDRALLYARPNQTVGRQILILRKT
jgi:tRNA G10  N-methylase Trm11